MMRKYCITTDNTSDLPESFYEKSKIGVSFLNYSMDNQLYTKDHQLLSSDFYEKMRKGSMPSTSQTSPAQVEEMMEPYLKEGYDIIHISFSSNLSGSYNNACFAVKELSEKYPLARIHVVDSLGASLGEGLMVYYAQKMKDQGKSYEEVIAWLEENKLHVCHYFTVDDLFHLHRGGRISKTTAVLGSMVNVKPLLHVDNEGHLVNVSKVRGRKKSIQWLAKKVQEQMEGYEKCNSIIFISHGDCLDDANYLKKILEDETGIDDYLINPVGSTIGAHSGPGTLAVFFIGKER